MKILLIILTFFLWSCSVNTQSLYNQKNIPIEANIEADIVERCDVTASFVETIAINRDAGVPLQGVTGWIIQYSKLEIAEIKDPEHKITTNDVLYRVLLGMWVYSNHDLSPEKIYTTSYNDCYNIMISNLQN